MNDLMKKEYEELYQLLSQSNMICYGSPDQYQYRQNQLLQKIAHIMLFPYDEFLSKEREKDDV
jgi:predicted protein tyrosine phosphatase